MTRIPHVPQANIFKRRFFRIEQSDREETALFIFICMRVNFRNKTAIPKESVIVIQ